MPIERIDDFTIFHFHYYKPLHNNLFSKKPAERTSTYEKCKRNLDEQHNVAELLMFLGLYGISLFL